MLLKLDLLKKVYGLEQNVVLGYRAPYALIVHERLDLYHKPPTKAKFLEEPVRRMQGQIGETIVKAILSGEPLEQAMLRVGKEVMAESQKIVPVDTGLLKATGFVEFERV